MSRWPIACASAGRRRSSSTVWRCSGSAGRQVHQAHRRGDHQGQGAALGRCRARRAVRRCRQGELEGACRRCRLRRRREGGHHDGVERPSGQRPRARRGGRARHHRRVFGLPVPVLQARRAHAEEDSRDVRRQGPPGVARRAAPVPLARDAGCGVAREARAEKGDAGFWAAHDAIFDAQPKLDDDDLASVARTLGLNAVRVKRAIAERRYETRSGRTQRWRRPSARPALPISSSTGGGSSGRSRGSASRRSSTRRSATPRIRSRRGPRGGRSTTRS